MDANNTSVSSISNGLQQDQVIEAGIELATASVDSVGNVAQKVGKHGNQAALAVAGIGATAVASASQQSGEVAGTAITLSTKVTEEANAALGAALATLKDVPVENFEFPSGISIPPVDFSIVGNETASLASGALKFIGSPAIGTMASNAEDLCSKIMEYVPLDLAKFEIIRDFYQILGILVECISFPIVFEEFFGTIAKFMSLAISDLFKYIISVSALTWWWIITVIAGINLILVQNFFRQDVSGDIDKVGLNVEVRAKKFDWKKQNQKDGGSRYRKVKYLLFLMTSIYAPVSRNAVQMIVCADKYAYARFRCESLSKNNMSNPNEIPSVVETSYGYLSEGNTLCFEVRQQLLPKTRNKGGLKRGTILRTANERLTITKEPSFKTTFNGGDVDTFGGACWNSEMHIIHALLSIAVVIFITIRFPKQMTWVIKAFRPKPIMPDDPKHPYKDPPQLGTPNYKEEKRKQMELGTKPVWFNDEGGIEEFTNAVYVREVARLGDNPYVYLYEMYEEQWAHYKTYVMWFKFVQIIPAVTLTAWVFDGIMPENSDLRSVIQASFAIFILAFYLYFACRNRPFVNPLNDILDQSCRMVLLFCPIITIVAFLNSNSRAQIWGTLLNVVTGVHLVFLIISSIFSGKSASTRLKKLTGRLQFTIGSVNYKGKVGTLPKWDMAMERKRRLWKPFWNHMFKDDIKLSDVRIEVDKKTKDEKAHRLPPVKPFVDGPVMPRPRERLDKMIEVLHVRGFKAWESNLLPLSPEETKLRHQVQTQLEGRDVYCDDTWTAVPGDSCIIDQQPRNVSKRKVVNMFERQSNWCTIVVSPFPFTVKIYWENCNVVGELVSWGLTKPRIRELLSRNLSDPEIIWKRQVRAAFRALAASKALLVCHIEKMDENTGKMIQYEKCTVEWPDGNDLSMIKNKKKLQQEIKLCQEPRFLYAEGTDKMSGTVHNIPQYFTLSELGIGSHYNKSNRLLNILGWVPTGNQNTMVVQNCIKQYHRNISDARSENLKRRVINQYSLSWGFWYFVYNNDLLSRVDLERYLNSGAEQNPLVRKVISRKQTSFNLLYSMLNFYDSSPLCAYWFSFWYDVWMHNQDLPKIKEAEKLLDFMQPDAICYKPVGIVTLRKILAKHNNPLGSKQELYVKALYSRLKEYALENKPYRTPLVSYLAPFTIDFLVRSTEVNKILDQYVSSEKYILGEETDDTKAKMPPLAIAKDMEGDLSKAMEIGIKAAQSSIDAYNFQLNQAKLQQQQAIALQQQRELESQKAQLEQLKMVKAQQQAILQQQQEMARQRQKQQEEMMKRQEEMYRQQQAAYAQNPNNPQNQVYMNSQMQQGMMSGQQGHTGGPGSLLAVQVPPGMGPGMMLQVETPNGQLQVQIPNGVTQGMTFHIQT